MVDVHNCQMTSLHFQSCSISNVFNWDNIWKQLLCDLENNLTAEIASMSNPLSKSCNNCIHQTSWLEKYASQTCIWSHPYQNPRVAGVLFRVTWPIIMRRVSSLGFNAVSFSWNCKCKLQMCKRPTLSSPKMIFIFYFSFANVRLIDVIDIRRPVKKTRQNWLWNHEK